MTEMHDVVKLLLARMESHPEEFGGDLVATDSREDRWWQILREVREFGTKEEKAALDQAVRKIKLQHAHEAMMDELLNGDERRRKQEEDYEYEQKLQRGLLQRQALQQQLALKQQDVTRLSQYPNRADMEKNGIMNALRNLYARL